MQFIQRDEFMNLLARVSVAIFLMVGSAYANSQTFDEVYYSQLKLKELGFLNEAPDGVFGPKTQAALNKSSESNGFEPTIYSFLNYHAMEIARSKKEVDEELERAIETAVREMLKDPDSAKFKNISELPSGKFCGEVNAKNSYGGYAGWKVFWVYNFLHNSNGWVILGVKVDDDIAEYACLLDLTGK